MYWINTTTYQVRAFINYSITARTLFLLRTKLFSPQHKMYHQLIYASMSYTLVPHFFSRLHKDKGPWIYKRRASWLADTQKAAKTQHTHPSTLNNNSYKLQTQTVTFTFVYSLFMVKITSSLSFPVQMQPKGLQQYNSEKNRPIVLTSKIKL